MLTTATNYSKKRKLINAENLETLRIFVSPGAAALVLVVGNSEDRPVVVAVAHIDGEVGVAAAQETRSAVPTTLTLSTWMSVELKQFASDTGDTLDASSVKMISTH